MDRGRVREILRRLVKENKTVLVLLLLVGLHNARQFIRSERWRRDSSKQTKIEDEPLTSAKDRSSKILVPGTTGKLRPVKIRHVSQGRFDADFAKFSAPRRPFFEEVRAIISILIPSLHTKALGYLVMHMGMLGLRTYLSLVVADLDGRIVRSLIGANGQEFVLGIMEWLILAIPASYTNAMIRYLEGKISLEFRTSLVRYIHDLYVGAHQEYYKVVNIDGSIEGIDHYITSDVTKFCNSAAKLYSSLGKPSLDLCIFSYQLSRNLGWKALVGICTNYLVTAAMLKSLAPPFGKLASREAKLEGDYRNAHSRVITNAEEIAFYDGAAIEWKSLSASFNKLKKHIESVLRIKLFYSVIEGYVLKYTWSASGYLFASIPVFLPDVINAVSSSRKGNNERDNMGKFVTNKRIMLSIADAGGRIMYSIKDIGELAGYTQRVYQLLSALHRVRKQAYGHRSLKEGKDSYTLADVHGRLDLTNKDEISFEKVPIVVPGNGTELTNGEVLLDPLTFEVKTGQHLLIVGSNGTGKSSIARISAGLWPVYRGLIQRSKNIAFLPQQPYFSIGTLRDQVIYPSLHHEMRTRDQSDDDLLEILKRVNLAYLLEREGGFDVVKEWKDVLSGGEKQRMMFARVLYANPKFAFIDEGTSAVSADMEGRLYDECKAQGITLLTISHRIALLKYHNMKLEIGLGPESSQWSFEDISSQGGWKSVDKEIEDIREFLRSVPDMESRHEEIQELLRH